MKSQRESDGLKSKWNQFASAGVLLFAVAATFMVSPPQLRIDADPKIDYFIKFLIAGVLALFTIPMMKRSKRSYYRFWGRLARTSLAAAVVAVGVYSYCVINWSVNFYNNKLLVTGSTMLPEAEQQRKLLEQELHRPMIDDETLVKARRGETQYIWPKQELRIRYYLLSILYIFSFLLVAVFIISVIQAIFCYEKGR